MERVRIPEKDRKDFLLYVDEFQNFATDSFASVLSEARKYRLGLIISHQYIGQLVTTGAGVASTKVRDAIFGNVGTTINFRVGAVDAEFLETQYMPDLIGQDLVNLPNHNVYIKLMIDGFSSRAFSATTLPPIRVESKEEYQQIIINNSRRQFGKPRREVEDMIAQWSGMRTSTADSFVPPPLSSRPALPPLPSRPGSEDPHEESPASVSPKPVYIKPKYETNLAELGIDADVPAQPMEVRPAVPPPMSLEELGKQSQQESGQGGSGNRKRKRGRGGRSGGGGFGLRETLAHVLGGGQSQQSGGASPQPPPKEEDYDDEPDRRS